MRADVSKVGDQAAGKLTLEGEIVAFNIATPKVLRDGDSGQSGREWEVAGGDVRQKNGRDADVGGRAKQAGVQAGGREQGVGSCDVGGDLSRIGLDKAAQRIGVDEMPKPERMTVFESTW